jgi:hypothetical protein
MDRFNAAWKELKAMGIDGSKPEHAAKINQVFQSYNLPGIYVGIRNGEPVIDITQYRRFGVIDGYVDGAVLGDGATFNSALTKVLLVSLELLVIVVSLVVEVVPSE